MYLVIWREKSVFLYVSNRKGAGVVPPQKCVFPYFGSPRLFICLIDISMEHKNEPNITIAICGGYIHRLIELIIMFVYSEF